jgi:hypothetical protein
MTRRTILAGFAVAAAVALGSFFATDQPLRFPTRMGEARIAAHAPQ